MRDMDDYRRNLLPRLQAWDAALARSPLRLEGPGLGAPAGWFLGPKAENMKLLLDQLTETVKQHCGYRTSYQPDDPVIITAQEMGTKEYRDTVDLLRKSVADLNEQLMRSAPIFSMRSHGHMLWDQVLPAMVGYFAGMLYNQNNVAAEASPVTTWLEIKVGNDLCQMLGYEVPPDAPTIPLEEPTPTSEKIVPWGHITCDGSVANIEALWAARNVKFFGVALRAALREVRLLAPARDITVRLLNNAEARLIDLDTWTLLNLKLDDLVSLPYRIATNYGLSLELLSGALREYGIQHIGILEFYERFLTECPQAPVVMAPATCHYSLPKAGTLLGLGQNNILKVKVDLRARMVVPDLVEKLRHCLVNRVPVIAVVAVIGSTEESAVDPLRNILDAREALRREGLDFAVHCDAAWGGYFNSMYLEKPGLGAPPEWHMSKYVGTQYAALKEADSITVDPHKAGFAPYPVGGLCYRNSALRDVVSLAAPVVFHSKLEPTVGIYGIEGSKPGAAATAVYLAHRVIRPTKHGYGKILGQCIWVSKRMYCRLLTMGDRDPRKKIKLVTFQMLPAEIADRGPQAVEGELEIIKSFVPLSNRELEQRLDADSEARELFEELGSDQVILAYAFNFFDLHTGTWNQNSDKLNMLNLRVYEICSISNPECDPKNLRLIITGSQFDVESYGSEFIEHYARRLGVTDAKRITFLISTTMNPWTTDVGPPINDFLGVVEDALRDAVYQAIRELGFAPSASAAP
jgi:glutamate/tyrosine decarboxylase-like PLP-dependent enzyme